MKAFSALSALTKQLHSETSPRALFSNPPIIRCRSDRLTCTCGAVMNVMKTRMKQVVSLNGPFTAHETISKCSSCQKVFNSPQLLLMVPSRCNVAYDIIVYVGKAFFQRYRTIDEVLSELRERGSHLSKSEISFLGKKFIHYLAKAHRLATPRIQQDMNLAGGYILHLDATHEADSSALMTGLDGLSKMVLSNIKVPSESAEHIEPFLENIKNDFGTPLALVHDMGTGICKAVENVFKGTPDYICHFHFLRDLGKDFLDESYNNIRKRLRHFKISGRLRALARDTKKILPNDKVPSELLAQSILEQSTEFSSMEAAPSSVAYALTLWIIQGKKDGSGYGYPFDRPYLSFSERILSVHSKMPELMGQLLTADKKKDKHLIKLSKVISEVAQDDKLLTTGAELKWRCKVFDELRGVMRIAPVGGNSGLNDNGEEDDISSIKNDVLIFRKKLGDKKIYSSDRLCQKMADQIDKYGEKLFTSPISVSTPQGTIEVRPQRTNNILEQFFRGIKQSHRRRTGNSKMGRYLQTMLADTPLIKNLDNPKYLPILLNGKKNLEELFAHIDEVVEKDSGYDQECQVDKVLPGFKKLMNNENLLDNICSTLNIAVGH
jgi:hypothetical protein